MANMISGNKNSKSRNGGKIGGAVMATDSAPNVSTKSAASPIDIGNVIGSSASACNNSSGGVSAIPVASVGENVTNLSDIRSYLQPINSSVCLPAGVCPYDHIIEMIRGLDLQDDGITMNHKIKSIETDFCNIVRDENMLCESMEYINNKALEDGETALKFALLFASHNFDVLAMKETKVRTAMLTLLQKNFVNAETYRVHDRERLYNSITLLGEYYHRVRLADNTPINILGESLLALLIREIKEEKNVNDVKLAKLILSQITLNGDLMRNIHKTEISQLLYHIRKNLIEQQNLKPTVKAIMLMTLDLFYSNFSSLGSQLEGMYTKYFIMEDDHEGNNNQSSNQTNQRNQQEQQQLLPSSATRQSKQQENQTNNCPQQNYTCLPAKVQQHNSFDEVSLQSSSNNTSYENGDSCNVNDNTEDEPGSYKKWSEQVCEDSFEEHNGVESELNMTGSGQEKNKNYGNGHEKKHFADRSIDNDSDRQSRNSRRSFQPRQSPRPLKQHFNSNEQVLGGQDSQNSGNEERDETKPLPRWRAPRFNRDDQNKEIRSRNFQRRFSASFEDDRQSVRSDGGSIRLYSINDRLKYAQEKIERSGNQSAYCGIANSNWDRQSQRDDRSERSYMSNYERGNNHRRGGGGGRSYNNRSSYDKPPRFQKNKNSEDGSYEDKNSKTWRSTSSNLQYLDENSSYNTNGPESNSRSSSRARTLPRPAKSRMDNSNQNNSYRRSQSPSNYQRGGGYNQHHNKNRTPKFGSRYSSQSSLTSDASSTLDRRHHQKNRSFSRRSTAQQQIPSNDIKHWNDKDTNSELVRNARQTTDYMNYLSSKK